MRFPERECSDQDHFAQNLVLVKEKLGPELTRVGHWLGVRQSPMPEGGPRCPQSGGEGGTAPRCTCVPTHAQIALAFPHMRSTCAALAQLHSGTGTNLTRVQETQVRKRKCGNACAVGCSAVKRLSPAAPVAPRAPKFHLAPNPVQAMPILELTFYAPRQNLEKNGLNLNTPAPGASVE